MNKNMVPDWRGTTRTLLWVVTAAEFLSEYTQSPAFRLRLSAGLSLLWILTVLGFYLELTRFPTFLSRLLAVQPLSPIQVLAAAVVLTVVMVLVCKTLFRTKGHDETSDENCLSSVVMGVVGGRSFSDGPTSQSKKEWASNLPSETKGLLMQSIAINSTAFEEPPTFIGSPTETALLRFARSHLGMGDLAQTRDEFNIVHIMPFDSRNRFMGTIIKLPHSGGYRVFLMGDPSTLLGYCTDKSDLDAAARSALTDADREGFKRTIEAYSERSLHTLGLVYRDVLPTEASIFPSEDVITPSTELRDMGINSDKWVASTMHDMTFLGLFGTNLHQPNQAMVDFRERTLEAPFRSLGSKNITPIKNMLGSAFEWHVLGKLNGKPVEALADTGANCNAISASCASERHLMPDPGSTQARIRLPSGKYCVSLGTTTVQFQFHGEDKVHNVKCNIVPKLKQACVLALGFLRTTETLTSFKSRLKEVPLPKGHRMSLRLMRDRATGIDSSNGALTGYVAGGECLAMPDSGSSIMALSGRYVRSRQMRIDRRNRCRVRFIDGSSAWTSGTVTATWQFCRSCIPLWDILHFILYFLLLQSWLPHARPPWTVQEWHVIENMDVDAILSINFIKEHDIFRAHESSFITRLKRSHIIGAKIYGICPYPEGSKRLETLASSFYTDIQSPNPFTYHMLVREDARRSENQEAIANLAPGFQEAARLAEIKRRQFWDDLKQKQEAGGNAQQQWSAGQLLGVSTSGTSASASSARAANRAPARKHRRFWLRNWR